MRRHLTPQVPMPEGWAPAHRLGEPDWPDILPRLNHTSMTPRELGELAATRSFDEIAAVRTQFNEIAAQRLTQQQGEQ